MFTHQQGKTTLKEPLKKVFLRLKVFVFHRNKGHVAYVEIFFLNIERLNALESIH